MSNCSHNRSDVVVIGGGFAGLTAACRAAEHGLRVIVLERGAQPDYICNSRVCTGVYHIGWMPETVGEEALYERIMARSGGTARADLARMIAGTAASVKQWLIEQGAVFEPHYSDPHGPEILSPRRTLGPGFDWQDRGPDRMLRMLQAGLEARGGELHLNTAGDSLIMESGACVGVMVSRGERVMEYRASAVVVADGGFQANTEAVSRYIAPAERLQQRNVGTAIGDGLRMCADAGAALVGLDRFYGHLLSRDAFSRDDLWPYPQLDVLAATGIVVDASGRRFTDEGQGGVAMANEVARLADPLGAWIVFDSEAWQCARHEDTVPPNPSMTDGGGTILTADSVTDLATAAGIDPRRLAATIDRYNKACRSGDFEALDPPRNTGTYTPRRIGMPPYHAVPACAGITVTTGGVAVDGKARVVGADDIPIPGLLAAGSTVGGVEGGSRSGYVGGISKAFILGYRAAETAAGSRQ